MSDASHQPYDDAFKAAVAREPRAFFALLGVDVTGPVELVSLRGAASLDLDYAAWVPVATGRALFHVEFIRSPNAKSPIDVITWHAVIARREGAPVRTIVALLADGPRHGFTSPLRHGALSLDVTILRLRDCPGLAESPELAELALLTVPRRRRAETLVVASETLGRQGRLDQLQTLLELARALKMGSSKIKKLERHMSGLLQQAEERGIGIGVEKGIGIGVEKGRVSLALSLLRSWGVPTNTDTERALAEMTEAELAAVLASARAGESIVGTPDLVPAGPP